MVPALLVIAFLAGSIPFGYLIGRAKGIDIRAHGSGNIGATNVTRVLGRSLGRVCFALDMAKGLLPTVGAGLALHAFGRWDLPATQAWTWIVVALAAIAGHVFCPWLGFKGGKGVATGLGALLGLFPFMSLAALGALVLWIAVAKLSQYVSLASIIAGLSLPLCLGTVALLAAWQNWIPRSEVFASATPFGVLSLGLAGFVIYTHRANLRRLRDGTEPRIGRRPTP